MASPILSRSPSATFAPGPHRRSHPNLQNLHSLSLAPLTPKYPIGPADYDAYFDPSTNELHTSASLSQIAALPSPGGILTNSPARSRNTSRSRLKRKVKSRVNIQEPERENDRSRSRSYQTGDMDDLDDAEIVDHKPIAKSASTSGKSRNRPQLHLSSLNTQDPSWLVQTGLSLTESSRETKGQSWISKRDSSTNLASTASVEGYVDLNLRRPREGRTPRSGRATPATARSRVGSRTVSRNASHSRLDELRMTTGYSLEDLRATALTSFATAPEVDDRIREEDEDEFNVADMEPNWADEKTQAEVAAQLQEELAEEYENYDGDPYGMLDFEGQGDGDTSEDEAEVRRAMRRWRVGGWMDGAIDALLLVEQESAEKSRESDVDVGRVSFHADEPGDIEDMEPVQKGWTEFSWVGDFIKRNVLLSRTRVEPGSAS